MDRNVRTKITIDGLAAATTNLIKDAVANSLENLSEKVLTEYKNEEGPTADVYLKLYTALLEEIANLRGESDEDDEGDLTDVE